ncbi:hypothetical protein P886_0971 [Alteromonadaceae bacterium 2753L.S.0a.02]|nr:hypothetical protein P886_0971 [Alteromonadaceae bacterium 2753L.S.0a.02]
MKFSKSELLFTLFIALSSMLLSSCGAVHTLKDEQVSPQWPGKAYKNITVVGVYEDMPYRSSAETGFAEAIKALGINAQTSYASIKDLQAIDTPEEITKFFDAVEGDAVLAVATIDPGYDYDYGDALATRGMVVLLGGRPGPYTDLGNFIAWAGSGSYSLLVALWDTKTQALVWQAKTSSQTTGSESEDIKALAETVVTQLRGNGLL